MNTLTGVPIGVGNSKCSVERLSTEMFINRKQMINVSQEMSPAIVCILTCRHARTSLFHPNQWRLVKEQDNRQSLWRATSWGQSAPIGLKRRFHSRALAAELQEMRCEPYEFVGNERRSCTAEKHIGVSPIITFWAWMPIVSEMRRADT